jgi:hypothetical protein
VTDEQGTIGLNQTIDSESNNVLYKNLEFLRQRFQEYKESKAKKKVVT